MKNFKNLNLKKFAALTVGFVLLFATVFGVVFGAKSVAAKSFESDAHSETAAQNRSTSKRSAQISKSKADYVLQYITTESVSVKNDFYEIYGNSTVTDREFRNIVMDGTPKIYLNYRTDRTIDLPYDALLIIKSLSNTYSYEFIEQEKSDEQSILRGVHSFIKRYADVLNGKENFILENNAPMTLAMDVPTTFIGCIVEKEYLMRFDDKGYIVYHIAISRYTVNSESIIFIVSVNNSFVPGVVANKNDETGYKNFNNKEGYVHMTVAQAYDANEEYYYGRRWGNVPYKKDYWPVNEPTVCAITSSIQTGLNLGYSFKNGFSLDGISIGGERNIGANISYGYSKAYTGKNPAFSAQVNSTNTDKCEWNYIYNEDNGKAETYHLNTNYMFEISNSRADMFIGEFRLILNYKFVVDKVFSSAKTNTGTADLFVRAGEYKDIYGFCNGMV